MIVRFDAFKCLNYGALYKYKGPVVVSGYSKNKKYL